MDPGYARFFPGLDLTEVNVLPHYQKAKDDLVDGLRLFEDITLPDSLGRCFTIVEACSDPCVIRYDSVIAGSTGRFWAGFSRFSCVPPKLDPRPDSP